MPAAGFAFVSPHDFLILERFPQTAVVQQNPVGEMDRMRQRLPLAMAADSAWDARSSVPGLLPVRTARVEPEVNVGVSQWYALRTN